MRWILVAFCSLWWPIAGGVVVSLFACALRRWSLALTVAGWSATVGAFVFGVLVLLLLAMYVNPGAGQVVLHLVAKDSLEPAQKARALAETIATMMNCGALACIAGFLCGLIWALVRWRMAATAG